MIGQTKIKQLKRAIRQLVRAEVADATKGGTYPEDWPLIEEELRRARIRVGVLLTKLGTQEEKGN